MERVKKFFGDWTMFEKAWLTISSILMIVLSLIWGDSILALLSGLAGTISVVLCAKGKIENYAFGLFQAVTYAFLCFQSHIYGEVMYNILMVPMIIIGFISWRKNMASGNEEVKARNLTPKGWIILIIGSIAAVAGYSMVLKMLGGSFAMIDATSTTLSVIATLLMLARYSEQWVMWVIVNVASVILWGMALMKGDSGAITLVVMWSAYLFNSVYGYINWRKMAKAD
ncbi:nicotinamide riboside transporter PnuC [Hespellia stercorisuis]|uniref:Nicotinamide mononucleotide transporter n=1 Tax=Hespellia stercorisuis DSM 15480 TaxID=1121950 RepID=A0A1M6QYX2_9FIRM|nr:nicotinamide riboside transporter PnuC [Hespellia stercorisuis]SHK25353.1 nicotinamide mononucleotide transporter [Hespellia stercorisuis DSM 15480]